MTRVSGRPLDRKNRLVIQRTCSLAELLQRREQRSNRIRLRRMMLNPRLSKLQAVHVLGLADAVAQQNDAIADSQRNRYRVKSGGVEQAHRDVPIHDRFYAAA